MANLPSDLIYTSSHEWLRKESDGTLTIGITDHAQEALGDIVFVELPDAGRALEKGETCAMIESVKAASDIYAPVAGEVVEQNTSLADTPEAINGDAYGCWLFRIKPTGELEDTLDAAGYQAVIDAE